MNITADDTPSLTPSDTGHLTGNDTAGRAVNAVPSDAEFDREVTAFLRAHARQRVTESFSWAAGSDRVGLFRELSAEEDEAEVEAAKSWRGLAFDAGLGWISGPRELGGRGLPSRFERRYQALEAAYETPSQAPLGIGLNMVAPTILAHGQPTTRDRYVSGLRRGELVGCQLFSEPDAGSDLASVRTSAVRDGDAWTVTGEKLWTSHAKHAHIGLILCRTNTDVPKHRGLTAFVIDMRWTGIEVRPLRQMTGGATFNSVRLDGVRIPDDHRLGDIGGGWAVAMTTLMNERAALGSANRRDTLSTARLLELIRHFGDPNDWVTRQMMATVYSNAKISSYTSRRAMAKIRAGETPGAENSIVKLARTQNLRRLSDMLSHVLGPRLIAETGDWGTYAWSELVLGVPGVRIAGGTDEIMKNVVAERVLGLPKEPNAEPNAVKK